MRLFYKTKLSREMPHPSCFHLEEGVVSQHVGHLLCIVALIEKVQLQRHVLLGFFHQPHEAKVREQPMNCLGQYL